MLMTPEAFAKRVTEQVERRAADDCRLVADVCVEGLQASAFIGKAVNNRLYYLLFAANTDPESKAFARQAYPAWQVEARDDGLHFNAAGLPGFGDLVHIIVPYTEHAQGAVRPR